MTDLVQFLKNRIEEDEAVAAAAVSGQWAYVEGLDPGAGNILAVDADGTSWGRVAHDNDREAGYGACDVEDAAHIVRWQPRRVLAECAAKRRIIVRFEQEQPKTGWDQGDELGRAVNRMACSLFHGVLRELAQPYAGHPDFDMDWLQP